MPETVQDGNTNTNSYALYRMVKFAITLRDTITIKAPNFPLFASPFLFLWRVDIQTKLGIGLFVEHSKSQPKANGSSTLRRTVTLL